MRIGTLDYLRGLMALGIMVYHYFSWIFHSYNSDSFLGIIGIYGVSIFYILSGLTLFYVYNEKLKLNNIFTFFIKRVFRILPLLWIGIFLKIYLLGRLYDKTTLFLNVTGLFGFVDYDNYIATGSWSIGNELVFYSIFPLLILLNNTKKYSIELLFVVSLIIGVYFAFFSLNNNTDLAPQWSTYINPLNQIFLFIGGILIGKIVKNKKNTKVSISIIISVIAFLFLFEVDGNQINIVSGYNRLIFSLVSFMVTIAFLMLDTKVPKFIDVVLLKLGHISYSLYLLHPIVFLFLATYISKDEVPIIFLLISISTSIVLSWFVYNYYELKWIGFGKKTYNLLSSKSI